MEVEVVLVWHCVMLLLGREPLVIVSLHSGACLELGSWHVKCAPIVQAPTYLHTLLKK